MVNSSAICQRIAAGTHSYAAILILDRDQDIVGRRLGGAVHHDNVVRRVVALKDIANEVGGTRSVPALASAVAWLGSGAGGIIMGRIADRVGTRGTVICGGFMIGLGLAISTLGPPLPLWIGHGLFIGLTGLGGIVAPLYIYVSRCFDRRLGSALPLTSSGS